VFFLGSITPFSLFELKANWLSGNKISLDRLEVYL
jgi:hypothetical protein